MPLQINWPMPDLRRPSFTWHLGCNIAVPAVGILSKILFDWFNNATVYNREVLINALERRLPGKPLLTLSNHHSCIDDPVLWGILNWRHLCNSHAMRWSAAAEDICFTREFHARFFAFGKTFPMVRGEGVYQKAMDFCLEILNAGHWLHFFPEGKINLSAGEFVRLKWGVGRLISECKEMPIIIPFWHEGMNKILPNKTPYIPQVGKVVTVLIGKPMDFTNVLEKMRQEMKSAKEKRKVITDLIQEEFKRLKEQTETLHRGGNIQNGAI